MKPILFNDDMGDKWHTLHQAPAHLTVVLLPKNLGFEIQSEVLRAQYLGAKVLLCNKNSQYLISIRSTMINSDARMSFEDKRKEITFQIILAVNATQIQFYILLPCSKGHQKQPLQTLEPIENVLRISIQNKLLNLVNGLRTIEAQPCSHTI